MKASKSEVFKLVLKDTESYLNYLKEAIVFTRNNVFLSEYIRYCEESLRKIKAMPVSGQDFSMQLFFILESLRNYYAEAHWFEDEFFKDRCSIHLSRIMSHTKQLL